MRTLLAGFLLACCAYAQNPAPAPNTCAQQANISITTTGVSVVIPSQGLIVHVCNLVWSASAATEVDFVAIQGSAVTTLHGNVNVLTYSWNWNGDLTTKPGGIGSNFGFNVTGTAATIKGSVSYYLAQN